MSLFADAFGHAHRVRVTYDAVCRVREALDLNLLDGYAGEPPLWKRIWGDEALLVDVLYHICDEDVSGASFARALRGGGWRQWWAGPDPAALEPARAALFEAWVEFFPESEERDDIRQKVGEKKTKPVNVEKYLWEFAGILGVHPGPFTLRQLMLMVEGRGRSEWARTAVVAAGAWNSVMMHSKRPKMLTPDDFNPYQQQKKKVSKIKYSPTILGDLFLGPLKQPADTPPAS